MVIWLFAGGGVAEIRGLVPFFEQHYPPFRFIRMTPVFNKPGPRPGITPHGYGKTGKSLASEIQDRLPHALGSTEGCSAILVIDDLDCHSEMDRHNQLAKAIDSVEGAGAISNFIGFAVPELESWIIADWDNSVARHEDFRARHDRMRYWLSTEGKVRFDAPESFGKYNIDKDSCDVKLSEVIIASTMVCEEDQVCRRYSKGFHTPALLGKIDPEIVKNKCPIFRRMHIFLKQACRSASA